MPASDKQGHAPPGVETAASLVGRLASLVAPSSVIVCVGDEMRGDDGAGPAVAKELSGTVPWTVLDAQNAPENFLMKVVAAKPESVVLIDALHFGGRPGAIRVIRPGDLAGCGPSTHGPAPLTFFEALNAMHPCRRAVVGIQPRSTELGAPACGAVKQGVRVVVGAFRELAQAAQDAPAGPCNPQGAPLE